ncbi:hypothetical protein ABVK25_008819 [Lepraria finkii]|uniref:Uncharacterized protein n=1 Tax=Lepraria finkii TaxID=1340010 RepID=A0ABR4AZ43_9LECA
MVSMFFQVHSKNDWLTRFALLPLRYPSTQSPHTYLLILSLFPLRSFFHVWVWLSSRSSAEISPPGNMYQYPLLPDLDTEALRSDSTNQHNQFHSTIDLSLTTKSIRT